MSSMISKTRLINLSTPDINIAALKNTNQNLYNAIKNLGDADKQLINSVFPPAPSVGYRGRIILFGTQSITTDVLSHRYHIVLPIDPTGYWQFTQINLVACYITAKILPVSSPLSVDLKISQKKGTTAYKSLFKPGFNPILPVGVLSTHNVEFAINTLYQDDIGRVDVLAADATVSGVEIVLVGNYGTDEIGT